MERLIKLIIVILHFPDYAAVLIATCTVMHAQTAKDKPDKPATTKSAKAKLSTHEEFLMKQFNEKFEKLDELNEQYDSLTTCGSAHSAITCRINSGSSAGKITNQNQE